MSNSLIDAIISLTIAFFVSIKITPYWDQLKAYYELHGRDFTTEYQLLQYATLLGITILVYLLIEIIKHIIKKLDVF